MINLWRDFPSPERFYFKSSVSKAKKSMINYGYINHQAKFIETRPVLQTSLNLVIFGKIIFYIQIETFIFSLYLNSPEIGSS